MPLVFLFCFYFCLFFNGAQRVYKMNNRTIPCITAVCGILGRLFLCSDFPHRCLHEIYLLTEKHRCAICRLFSHRIQRITYEKIDLLQNRKQKNCTIKSATLSSSYLCLISVNIAWEFFIQECLNSLDSFIQKRWNDTSFNVRYNIAA